MPRGFLTSLFLMFGIGVAAFAALWAYTALRKTTPAQKIAALKEEVEKSGGTVFETVLQGKPVSFLLKNCEVFLLDASGEELKRNKVLKPGFYLGFTGCTSQSIDKVGEYVTVYLANQAIGAGGGNITGGNYRSLDGLVWEKKYDKGWSAPD